MDPTPDLSPATSLDMNPLPFRREDSASAPGSDSGGVALPLQTQMAPRPTSMHSDQTSAGYALASPICDIPHHEEEEDDMQGDNEDEDEFHDANRQSLDNSPALPDRGNQGIANKFSMSLTGGAVAGNGGGGGASRGGQTDFSIYDLPDPNTFGEPRLSYGTSCNSARTSDVIREYNDEGQEVTVRIRQSSNGAMDQYGISSNGFDECPPNTIQRTRSESDGRKRQRMPRVYSIVQPESEQTPNHMPQPPTSPRSRPQSQLQLQEQAPSQNQTQLSDPQSSSSYTATTPPLRKRLSRPMLTDEYIRRAMTPEPLALLGDVSVEGFPQHFDPSQTETGPAYLHNHDVRAEMSRFRTLSRSETISSQASSNGGVSSRFEFDHLKQPSLLSRSNSGHHQHDDSHYRYDGSSDSVDQESGVSFSRSGSVSSQRRRYQENFEFHYGNSSSGSGVGRRSEAAGAGVSSYASENDTDAGADTSRPLSTGFNEELVTREIDETTVARWGGVQSLIERLETEIQGQYDGGVLEDLGGATHIYLPDLGNESEHLPSLLETLLPVVSSTLVSLNISNNHLGALPMVLRMCHNLEHLDISGNPINFLPFWIGRLSNLKRLIIDNCGLKALPNDLANARNLITILARNNRLISLPSWLSQLGRLETLLVDGNQFAGPWATLVDAISTRVKDDILHDIPPVPPVPHAYASSPKSALKRLDAHPTTSPYGTMRPSPRRSRSATAGPMTLSQYQITPPAAAASSDALPTPTTVTAFPLSAPIETVEQLTIAPPPAPTAVVPDSAASSDPVRPAQPDAKPYLAGRGSTRKAIRRMRSAGALLGIRAISEGKSMNSVSGDPLPPSPPVTVIQPRFASAGARTTTVMSSNYHDPTPESDIEEEVARRSTPTVTEVVAPEPKADKPRKWGFLKKMSMSKLRGVNAISGPRPPMPATNSLSEYVRRDKIRPSLPQNSVSAMVLPISKTIASPPADIIISREYIPTLVPAPSPKDFDDLPLTSSPESADAPSLDISIPSTSPFMPINMMSRQGPVSTVRPTSTASVEVSLPSRAPSSSSVAYISSPERNRSYEVGLRSIMSYLKDLHDLSLPVPNIIGGAEIVHSESIGGSTSLSGSIDPRSGSPSPYTSSPGGRPSTLGRPRRTTGDSGRERQERTEIEYSVSSSSRPSSRRESMAKGALVEEDGRKKYKDDSGTRTNVIKHIVDTEQTYCRGLRDLIEIYVKPASAPSGTKGETVVPAAERKIVFGGIEGILRFHLDSFLPALEAAAKELIQMGDDPEGNRSKQSARKVGEVFRMYHPFMRQYSAYINNFDYALTRLMTWTISDKLGSLASNTSTTATSPAASVTSVATASMGLGIASSTPPMSPLLGNGTNGSTLTPAQRRRIKTYLQTCRAHPKHTQINLESYLLLPVQRIPRYKMLLEDLARSTPPDFEAISDPIEESLQEMVALASTMNEEKRDSESRRQLVRWQSRIKGRFATPLVQAHRRLLMDGPLTVTRIVKRASIFVEIPSNQFEFPPTPMSSANPSQKDLSFSGMSSPSASGPNSPALDGKPLPSMVSQENRTIVQIESLHSETPHRPVTVCLTSDLMILCKDPSGGQDPNSMVELYSVLKMQTKRKPAMVVHGNSIRLVDNKVILYLQAPTPQEATRWVRTINNEFDPVR